MLVLTYCAKFIFSPVKPTMKRTMHLRRGNNEPRTGCTSPVSEEESKKNRDWFTEHAYPPCETDCDMRTRRLRSRAAV